MIQDTVLQEHQDPYFPRAIDRAITINAKIKQGQPSNSKVHRSNSKVQKMQSQQTTPAVSSGKDTSRDAKGETIFRLLYPRLTLRKELEARYF